MRSQSEIGNEMNNTSEEAITMVCSIVMPLYNNIADVGGAVHSVLEQTVSDFELIIVSNLVPKFHLGTQCVRSSASLTVDIE